ncbi:MAG: hypothetical protein F9K40_01290 [Kofleriaceae bacterium]|nr:MAG: hypothetical protein F9K40_01290 [Kofleriaceae bacterium]
MRRESPTTLLAREVAQFESELGKLALKIVTTILAEELSRPATDAGQRRPSRSRAKRDVPARTSGATSPSSPIDSGKTKRQWTRESVISELGTWLIGGNADAAFVKRHGPPGLVAAAKRFFGRFDAALNAANLAISDHVAAKRRDQRQDTNALPALRELAWQQQRRRRATASGT